MLVVTIIGILAALVVPGLIGRSEQTRRTASIADVMGGITTALNLYEVAQRLFPKEPAADPVRATSRTPGIGTGRI